MPLSTLATYAMQASRIGMQKVGNSGHLNPLNINFGIVNGAVVEMDNGKARPKERPRGIRTVQYSEQQTNI